MLEKLFTSKTRTRLLMLLLFNQKRDYHLRELARLVQTSPIHVAREMENLATLNLVKKTKKANLSIYSINPSCVFLSELKAIFLKTEYIGNIVRKYLKGKAQYALIYGSLAQGTETPASDVDLFVVSEMQEDDLVTFLPQIEGVLNREINYVLWNQKTFIQNAKGGHYLLRSIKGKKIIMLIGDEDGFKKQIQ